jgi:signal transduction histidine kinase/CheY-like chemotaxis protein
VSDFPELDSLLDGLAEPATRREAAAALAAAIGCKELLLFVLDPEVGAFMPASGMPKTLHGGPLWRAFLTTCARPGAHQSEVDLPALSRKRAWAVSRRGALIVALGGTPDEERMLSLERRIGVLGALLSSQLARAQLEADAELTRESAHRDHSLLAALEAARSEAAGLNVRLTEESKRKDEFLAMLAHELRNPLAPLVNSVELLRRVAGRAEPATLRRALDVMSRQLSHMARLINDLLDVSRVSRGAIELERELLSLEDVLQLACETAAPAIESKRHRLEVSAPEQPVYVEGDRARLIQIFGNLLNNAAKFTPPGGEIRLRLSAEGGRARVAVRDNGMGIAPDMIESIFQLFSQAHSTLARSEGGLGIGLTLARTLARLHGGSLEARSDGLGLGSEFVVSLPAANAPTDTRPTARGAHRSGLPARPGIRVLLVEDNSDSAASMAELLRHMGAEPLVAPDGPQALERARGFGAQLVLLDIGLPGMSGYEVAARLRPMLGGRARIVALTGYGAPEDEARALAAGFDEHLVKPASAEALERLLKLATAGAC